MAVAQIVRGPGAIPRCCPASIEQVLECPCPAVNPWLGPCPHGVCTAPARLSLCTLPPWGAEVTVCHSLSILSMQLSFFRGHTPQLWGSQEAELVNLTEFTWTLRFPDASLVQFVRGALASSGTDFSELCLKRAVLGRLSGESASSYGFLCPMKWQGFGSV